MADEVSDLEWSLFPLYEGTFDKPVDFQPENLPQGTMTLLNALLSFCAERSGRRAMDLKTAEIDKIGAPVLNALREGQLKATCIALDGPHLKVDPVAFFHRQTWLANFERDRVLPSLPKVGIEPGFLIVDQADFKRVATGLRAADVLKDTEGTYIPQVLKFAIEAVYRFGVKGGQFKNDDFRKFIGEFAQEQEIALGDRALNYLAKFIVDKKHSKNGWTSDIPPVLEFAVEIVKEYEITEDWKFDRRDFKNVIIERAKQRKDLGIADTDAGYLSTFCGNPRHSSGGATPNKPGSRRARPSIVHRSKLVGQG